MKKAIIILLFNILLSGCKKNSTETNSSPKSDSFAVALFAYGDIQKNGESFKQNHILQYNEELKFSPKSYCELQIDQEDWIFRVKGTASFQLNQILSSDNTTQWSINFTEGSLTAKLGRKLRTKEIFRIITPLVVIGVRGTSFELDVAADGSAKIQVLEGSVAVEFSTNNFSQKPELQKSFQGREMILEKGTSFFADKKMMQGLLSAPEKETSDPNFFQTIQKKFVTKLPDKEILLLEKAFSSLSPIPVEAFAKPESRTEAIALRTKEKSPEILKLMESVSGLKQGTIVLLNGEEIPGLIEMKDKLYSVETPFGRREFSEKEVLEINVE